MALEPLSPEHEASIAHEREETKAILRAQRLQFCAQYPAGECPEPSMMAVIQTGYTTNPGKWDETQYRADADGTMRVDWASTTRARIGNAPVLYAGGGLLAAYILTKAVR